MRLWQYIRRNLYFMVSIVTVFISVVFALLITISFNLGESVEETSVGFIYLGNHSFDQYDNVLTTRISQWQETADFKITYQGYDYDLDLTQFSFDLNQTIANLTVNKNNIAYFGIPISYQDFLETELNAHFTEDVILGFNYDQFMSNFISDMRLLKNRKVYVLSHFLNDEVKATVLHQVTIDNLLAQDVTHILSQVDALEIQGKSRFSLLNELKDSTLDNQQLSIIASALQSMTRRTHFEGFIFDQYYTLPSWASLGQNVRILRVNGFDFTFYNRYDAIYTVTLESSTATSLTFSMIGNPYRLAYDSFETSEIIVPFHTIIVENPGLATDGDATMIETETEYLYEKEVQSGVNGFVLFYYRTISFNEEIISTIKLYDEQILSTSRIIERYVVIKDGA